jgi:delta1-piperideine-2-carboxylate reductase
VLRIDAANGFAQPALAAGLPWALQAARTGGIALVAIRRSHHFGALWADVEPLAEAGFLAITFVSAISRVVPHGARQPVYGTNPMAFAAPRADGGTLTFDQSSSTVAMGEVRIAARDGHTLPLGLGVDRRGAPTTDPTAILEGGALLPFGGHKGSSIAMMVEIMAAALTGADYSFEIDRTGFPGAETARAGQTLILIDPTKTGGQAFAGRIEQLVEQLHTAGQDRLPGDRRHARRRSVVEGIPLRRAVLSDLRKWAGLG